MAQFTKYTGSVNGLVGSLIAAMDAALVVGQSWTTPFTGTNKKVYRPPSGSRFYLRVDDNGSGTGLTKEALIRGGEVMSDADTFTTNPFPSSVQSALTANSLVVRKSMSADAVVRSYKIWADARTFYLFTAVPETAAGDWYAVHFGEFYDFAASPAYNCGIIGRAQENFTARSAERFGALQPGQTSPGVGYYVARGHTGAGTSVHMSKHPGDAVGQGGLTGFVGVIPYPNPADGGRVLTQIWLHDTVTAVVNGNRGRMRGLWLPLHPIGSFNDGDVITGTAELSGRTFEIVKTVYGSSSEIGMAAIETSATLETN